MLYTDQHGDVTGRYLGASAADTRTYDPFGKVGSATGTTPAVGYQSGWTDPATGAVDMASRWYDPGIGGFQSRDTWTNALDTDGSANRYSYGAGDPMGNADPSGHDSTPYEPERPCIDFECVINFFKDWWHGDPLGDSACSMTKPPSCYNHAVTQGWGNAPHQGWGNAAYQATQTTRSRNNGNGNGNGGNWAPPFVPPPPPPPPPWIPPLYIRVKPPPPAQTVKPRVPKVRIDRPGTKKIDPGPGMTDDAIAITTGILKTATDLVGVWVVEIGRAFLNDRLHIWDGQNDPDAGDYKKDREDCQNGNWNAAQPINYFELDDRNRATGADACYQGSVPPGGSEATYTPPGYKEKIGMARGHLIAKSLGGDGAEPRNIVPLWQDKVNTSAMYYGVEKVVKRWIDGGATVYYRVEPVYSGKDPVPVYLRIIVVSDSGPPIVARIDNRK
jgi:RHS repeat-associated protein